MSENTASMDRRAGHWLKSQLTLTNIVVAITFIVSMVSWQHATEARNEMQDYRIQAIEKKLDDASATFMRRDLVDERFQQVADKLDVLERKVDGVRAAVR